MNKMIVPPKTEEEHKFTSTGIKFWRHPDQMNSYVEKSGRTVISTHISPEGACNLKCDYCSVSKRKTFHRIDLSTIRTYVRRLQSRGLKAVILTGGGEPTLYPDFNELVEWLRMEQNLSVALITNGTLTDRVTPAVWNMFSWVRISLNLTDDYRKRIVFPETTGILGCSLVYTNQTLEDFAAISDFVKNSNVTYIRVLPDCLLSQENLFLKHQEIRDILAKLGDRRFFHQFKLHGQPCSGICHQAYFRPYLSEVNGGTVYPCDSLVLNDACQHFADSYAICPAEKVLDFLDGKIQMQFDARQMCRGCVFTENIRLLDLWLHHRIHQFDSYTESLNHEEFV